MLIKSEHMEKYWKHVREVFKRINEYSFKLGPEKCEFFTERMKYLGQIIDRNGRKPDPENPWKYALTGQRNEATSIFS